MGEIIQQSKTILLVCALLGLVIATATATCVSSVLLCYAVATFGIATAASSMPAVAAAAVAWAVAAFTSIVDQLTLHVCG